MFRIHIEICSTEFTADNNLMLIPLHCPFDGGHFTCIHVYGYKQTQLLANVIDVVAVAVREAIKTFFCEIAEITVRNPGGETLFR